MWDEPWKWGSLWVTGVNFFSRLLLQKTKNVGGAWPLTATRQRPSSNSWQSWKSAASGISLLLWTTANYWKRAPAGSLRIPSPAKPLLWCHNPYSNSVTLSRPSVRHQIVSIVLRFFKKEGLLGSSLFLLFLSRSSASIRYIFNSYLLSELLLNKKLLNIYSIIVDERDTCQPLSRGYISEIYFSTFLPVGH